MSGINPVAASCGRDPTRPVPNTDASAYMDRIRLIVGDTGTFLPAAQRLPSTDLMHTDTDAPHHTLAAGEAAAPSSHEEGKPEGDTVGATRPLSSSIGAAAAAPMETDTEAASAGGAGASASALAPRGTHSIGVSPLAVLGMLAGGTVARPVVKGELVEWESYQKTIDNAYALFKTHNDLSMIPQASHALAQMKAVRDDMFAIDPRQAEALSTEIAEYEKQVRAINYRSPVPTAVDMDTVAEFSTIPKNPYYVDPVTRTRYIQPNYAAFFEFCKPLQMRGCYAGQTMGKHIEKGGRICDIFVLKKEDEQVRYEFPKRESLIAKGVVAIGRGAYALGKWVANSLANSSSESPPTLSADAAPADAAAAAAAAPPTRRISDDIEDRIRNQQALGETLRKQLESKAVEWGYDSFLILASDRDSVDKLMALGWTFDEAITQHVIIGFYRIASKSYA